jgi:hypothetical protein
MQLSGLRSGWMFFKVNGCGPQGLVIDLGETGRIAQ